MIEQLRHRLAAFILSCAFVAVYLGGVILLVIGLVLASRTWWRLIQRHASMWEIGTKTAEVSVLAVGFVLVLIIPFLQRRAVTRSGPWRPEHRSEMKSRDPITNQG